MNTFQNQNQTGTKNLTREAQELNQAVLNIKQPSGNIDVTLRNKNLLEEYFTAYPSQAQLQNYLQILEITLRDNLSHLAEATFIKISVYIRNSWRLLELSVRKLESLNLAKETHLLSRTIINLLVDTFLIYFETDTISKALIQSIIGYLSLDGAQSSI